MVLLLRKLYLYFTKDPKGSIFFQGVGGQTFPGGGGRNASFFRKVSEYDQEIPQSQTADNPVAPRGRAAQPSQDTRKTN